MYATKTLVAAIAVMAGVASAAPASAASNPVGSTTFHIGDVHITDGKGCALLVDTEHAEGCKGVAILSGTKNCENLTGMSSDSVCNGTASFDASTMKVSYVDWEYLATCTIAEGKCVTQY